MADENASDQTAPGNVKPETSKPAESDSKMLTAMRDRLKVAIDATSESREDEVDDLKFKAASPDTPDWQWPAEVLSSRAGDSGTSVNARPTLVMNRLPQHVLQITGDMKQNRPAGRVIPVDDKADIETAQMLEGVVRHIEYISDADVAYDTAFDNQVTFGEGYIRILTEYCDETSFEQDIKIGRVRNSFSVYMDPMIQDPCGSDAQWCFITQEMTKDEYESEFPDAMPLSSLELGTGDENRANWITENTVKVAEYFYFENEKKTLLAYRLHDGRIVNALEGSKEDKAAKLAKLVVVNKRETVIKHVKWCKTNGYEILEKRDWPGKWIPVVRVIGNEYEIDGQIYVSGIIRNAKDAQRMVNYWTSQEAEMLALAPKAPFVGYAGQFEGFEQQWKTANVINWPYMEVNPDAADPEGKPYPLPQRMAPPMAQNGLLQAKLGAVDDIKATTGQYDPSLGAKSNETSGKAILAREQQSDTGTYHYIDNGARAVRYVTRQVVDLIPKTYDTKRIARIVGLDGETDHVEIDPDLVGDDGLPVAMKEVRDEATNAVIKRIYNPSVGKYDVAVTTGPSYMTKRQQTADSMVQLAQSAKDPQESLLMKYFAIKNMDFPEAQEFTNALKKLIKPGVLDDGEESPELAQANQVIQGLQQQVEGMASQMQEMAHGFEAQRVENETFKADIDAYNANTKRITDMAKVFAPESIAILVQKAVAEAMVAPTLQQQNEETHAPEQPAPMQPQPMAPEVPQGAM